MQLPKRGSLVSKADVHYVSILLSASSQSVMHFGLVKPYSRFKSLVIKCRGLIDWHCHRTLYTCVHIVLFCSAADTHRKTAGLPVPDTYKYPTYAAFKMFNNEWDVARAALVSPILNYELVLFLFMSHFSILEQTSGNQVKMSSNDSAGRIPKNVYLVSHITSILWYYHPSADKIVDCTYNSLCLFCSFGHCPHNNSTTLSKTAFHGWCLSVLCRDMSLCLRGYPILICWQLVFGRSSYHQTILDDAAARPFLSAFEISQTQFYISGIDQH